MRSGSEVAKHSRKRCSHARWKRSNSMLSLLLVYLVLPIPGDALRFGVVDICGPSLHVGDSWTYHRWTQITDGTTSETKIDTVSIRIVGTEKVGNQEYHLFGDGSLYRASADGAVWRYDSEQAEEVLHCDLWRVPVDQGDEVVYEGAFRGEYEGVEIHREGPIEIAVGDSIYSGVFEFRIQTVEGGGRLHVHPQIGLLKASTGDPIVQQLETLELISFDSQSNRTTGISRNTWGTVKSGTDRNLPPISD